MLIITLDERQLCDFELITNGSFYPLDGFMTYDNYISCLTEMTINDGKDFFPLPITLPILPINDVENHKTVVFKHETGLELGEMVIESIYDIDVEKEAKSIIGYYDKNHPYIEILEAYISLGYTKCIGGKIIKYDKVPHYDFEQYRMSPLQMKEFIKKNGWTSIIGFQTRNPMHKSHIALTKYALENVPNGKLFINPVVGYTQIEDIDYSIRVKCYKEVLEYYDNDSVKLGLLPLYMKMGGPKEALLHALIRRNFGCTHFIVGRDHAGPSSKNCKGETFYKSYEAQELFSKYADIIGIKPIFAKEIVYVIDKTIDDGRYTTIDCINKEVEEVHQISGTEFRRRLRNNEEIPEWFSDEKVIDILKTTINKGFCVYFVGLSGSGKTTISKFLESRLKEYTNRPISILDGDIVRQNLSKGLGFSLEDRSTNVQRIGYVASEIVKHGGICLVANIAPFQKDRILNRLRIGKYIEVFVNTTIEECERRDVKGLYKKARIGEIKDFTGISSPFEIPTKSEIILDGKEKIENNLEKIINYLFENKFL